MQYYFCVFNTKFNNELIYLEDFFLLISSFIGEIINEIFTLFNIETNH